MENSYSDVMIVGSYVQDLAFKTGSFPAPGETRLGTFRMGCGGKGFNQAVACNRLGVKTSFLGAVGNDEFSGSATEFAVEEELTFHFEHIKWESTGAASIIVNKEGQNNIVVSPGANNYLTPSFIQGFSLDFKHSKVVLCQLESNIKATIMAFFLGRHSGAITILNPAPINEEFDLNLLRFVDILTPNESEFLHLMKNITGENYLPNVVDDPSYLKILCKKIPHVKAVIVTLGAKGSFVYFGEESFSVPVHKVDAIDTTGAGDAFSGALAAGLVRIFNRNNSPFTYLDTETLKEAVEFATRAAALSVTKEGTAQAMPYLNELL